MRLVVAGTGRSGTKYAKCVMERAGLVAGHEFVFDHQGFHQDRLVEAESSCYAAYHLDKIPDVPVALIYREPKKQIESSMAHFSENWPHEWFGADCNPHLVYHPEMESMSTFDALCFMYVSHHEMILDADPEWVFNIDHVDWYDILGRFGVRPDTVDAAVAAVPKNVNPARGPRVPLPGPLPEPVVEMYERLESM